MASLETMEDHNRKTARTYRVCPMVSRLESATIDLQESDTQNAQADPVFELCCAEYYRPWLSNAPINKNVATHSQQSQGDNAAGLSYNCSCRILTRIIMLHHHSQGHSTYNYQPAQECI